MVFVDPILHLKTFRTHMEELEKIITLSNKSVHPVLPHVNSLLHSAILACKASTVETREEFEKENIAPNKNMDHQWRFQKTSQPPGRKKRGQILR